MCKSELHPKMWEASIEIRLKECYLWPKTSSETISECIIWQFFMGSSMPLTSTRCVLCTHLSTLCSCCPNVTCSAWVRHWESFLKSVRNGTPVNSCAATGQSLNKFQAHSTYVHIKLAITHVNNWALTLINFPIFTQAPANLMWPQTQLFLGVAIPLNFVELENACTGL